MKFEVFTVCEKAIAPEACLTIIGIFDTLQTPVVPVVRSFCLAVRLRSDFLDRSSPYRFSIAIIDADGKPVVSKIEGTLGPANGGSDMAVNLVISFDRIEFRDFGPHELIMHIEGERRMSAPIHVKRKRDVRSGE